MIYQAMSRGHTLHHADAPNMSCVCDPRQASGRSNEMWRVTIAAAARSEKTARSPNTAITSWIQLLEKAVTVL